MKIYRTGRGPLLELEAPPGGAPEPSRFILEEEDWDALLVRDDLAAYLRERVRGLAPLRGPFRMADWPILAPIESQEVWAAGVTYYRSRDARMEEAEGSGGSTFYDRVYSAARPELFFKATPHRVAGPGEPIRIRKDSRWNVPEPELTLVITPSAKILGYTIGNDVSSRDIEGENPLYLPQAKVYDKSCALGPGILVSDEAIPPDTRIQLEVIRRGTGVFEGATTLSAMKRRPAELVEYLFRDQSFPRGCFLLTGTGIVPPREFTLETGDEVRIDRWHRRPREPRRIGRIVEG